MTKQIRLGSWECSETERRYINDILNRGWVTYGKYSRTLEEMWSRYVGREHGVICGSGTDALTITFRALKERHGWMSTDKVLVPAVTFGATINAVYNAGLTPRLIDVNESGFMDVGSLKKASGAGNVCVCPVHLWGTVHPRIWEIQEICDREGLEVVEDSCETIDRGIGNGHACFSMYFNHIVSGGVGGLITTDDSVIAYLCRSIANHGFRDVFAKRDKYVFDRVGFSSRVTEFSAALACAAFEHIEEILEKRERINTLLKTALKREGLLNRGVYVIGGRMLFPVLLPFGVSKWRVMDKLFEKGIETRDMMNITNQEAFKHLIWDYEEFSGARNINNRGIILPCHPGMSGKDCQHIARSMKEILVDTKVIG